MAIISIITVLRIIIIPNVTGIRPIMYQLSLTLIILINKDTVLIFICGLPEMESAIQTYVHYVAIRVQTVLGLMF